MNDSIVPASPDYGPAGKPSPGRVVRLHMCPGTEPIPADIYRVDPATGLATLVWDVLLETRTDRNWRSGVPFGASADGGFFWDYWPRV